MRLKEPKPRSFGVYVTKMETITMISNQDKRRVIKQLVIDKEAYQASPPTPIKNFRIKIRLETTIYNLKPIGVVHLIRGLKLKSLMSPEDLKFWAELAVMYNNIDWDELNLSDDELIAGFKPGYYYLLDESMIQTLRASDVRYANKLLTA